jgi:hypothetical protein|tara:strand:+ start:1048 stop:1512 length:465 start_codon:yes stop_codon:yes gene_type:complete
MAEDNEDDNIADRARDILDSEQDFIDSLSTLENKERVFIVLQGSDKDEEGFSILILDSTTIQEGQTEPHICTVMSAGILDLLNNSCDEVLQRGLNYIRSIKKDTQQETKTGDVVLLDDYRKAVAKDFSIPSSITVNEDDGQLEIKFTIEDDDNV